ncbi:MAG: VWA domain-containing protein [Chloroflexales bacterium]|nr:VWA domain-containing protein [Chloroflexales bacterium]
MNGSEESSSSEGQEESEGGAGATASAGATDQGSQSNNEQGGGEKAFKAQEMFKPKRLEGQRDRKERSSPGRRSRTRTTRKQGRYVTSRVARRVTDLALDATLRYAAPMQPGRRAAAIAEGKPSRPVMLLRSDLRQKVRVRKTRNAVCFVVDASWSMAADERMRATKNAVLSLLRDAYQRRDRVGLVSFQRDYATLLLPLTNSVEMAQKMLQTMPTGGRTPLSRGLMMGYEVLKRALRHDSEVVPLMVILTDGQANVAMTDLPPQVESYSIADFIATEKIRSVVIDTEHPVFERGLSKQLALHLKGNYYRLDDLREGGLVDLVRTELSHK